MYHPHLFHSLFGSKFCHIHYYTLNVSEKCHTIPITHLCKLGTIMLGITMNLLVLRCLFSSSSAITTKINTSKIKNFRV